MELLRGREKNPLLSVDFLTKEEIIKRNMQEFFFMTYYASFLYADTYFTNAFLCVI